MSERFALADELPGLRSAQLSAYIKKLLGWYDSKTCLQLNNFLDMKPGLPQRELGLMHDVAVGKDAAGDPDAAQLLEKLRVRLK